MTLVYPLHAVEYNIADKTISISPPEGFSDVSLVSQDTLLLFQKMYQGDTKLISAYVTVKDAKYLITGEYPDLERYTVVLSMGHLNDIVITKKWFSELRAVYHENYDTAFQEIIKKLDVIEKKGSNILSDYFDIDMMIEFGGIIPLGVDYETVSSIMMSQLMQTEGSIDGEPIGQIAAITTVVLLVNDKVINLNIYSIYRTDADREWTRATAQMWASQILDANEIRGDFPGSDIVKPGTHLTEISKALLIEEQVEYSLKDHPKANGLDISIKYPSSWEAKEGIRPHIVQNFTGKYDGSIIPMCAISVVEIPEFVALILNDNVNFDASLTQFIPQDAIYLDGGQTNFDLEAGAWVKYYMEGERSGVTLGMFSLTFFLFYNNQMLTVQCSISGVPDKKILIEDAFKSYLPVFQSIGNSIVIHDKWKKTESGIDVSNFSNSVIEDLFINIFISLILTWGIGLAPPLVTRFKILKHPMTKKQAIFAIIIFWIFNLIIFTRLGSSPSTNGSLLLVAWASYAILRKGSRKYNEQQKEKEAKQEKINKEREQHTHDRQSWEEDSKHWKEESQRAREEARKAQDDARNYNEEARKHAEQESKKNNSTKIHKDETYYADVLGLNEDFIGEDVHKCYRELAGKYHPDLVNHLGDKLKDTAEKEMKEINEAFNYFKKRYDIQ